MGNVAPQGTNRVDDDADFGASFVLSRGEVDEALASGGAPPRATAEAVKPNAASTRKKLIYTGVAMVTALLVVTLWLLSR